MSADCSKWTLSDIKKFIDVLMKVTICNDVQELKDHVIPESIWKEIGEKLNTKVSSLKTLWYNSLHLQLFCPEPVYINDIIIKLIECLHLEKISDYQDIIWNKVSTCFDGVPIIFLRKTFYSLIKIVKNKTNIKNLGEMIDYLYREYIPAVISSDSDQILPRLKYNEESISYIDTNIENQEFTNESIDDHE